MSHQSFLHTVVLLPMICLGTSSCAVMKKGQTAYNEWREKRGQREAERELAKAEKQAGLTDEAPLPDAQAPAVFLDYDNPNALTAAGTRAEGNRGAGWTLSGNVPVGAVGELPGSVGELTNTVTVTGEPMGVPIFHADGPAGAEGARPSLDPDLVRAWAGSIAQVTGTSLAEPLIAAAMTGSAVEPGAATAAAEDPGVPVSMRRNTAAAFAGQDSVGLKTSEHEADWSSRQ